MLRVAIHHIDPRASVIICPRSGPVGHGHRQPLTAILQSVISLYGPRRRPRIELCVNRRWLRPLLHLAGKVVERLHQVSIPVVEFAERLSAGKPVGPAAEARQRAQFASCEPMLPAAQGVLNLPHFGVGFVAPGVGLDLPCGLLCFRRRWRRRDATFRGHALRGVSDGGLDAIRRCVKRFQ